MSPLLKHRLQLFLTKQFLIITLCLLGIGFIIWANGAHAFPGPLKTEENAPPLAVTKVQNTLGERCTKHLDGSVSCPYIAGGPPEQYQNNYTCQDINGGDAWICSPPGSLFPAFPQLGAECGKFSNGFTSCPKEPTEQNKKNCWQRATVNGPAWICAPDEAGAGTGAGEEQSSSGKGCPINLFKPWGDVKVNEKLKIRSRHPVSGKPNRRHTGVDLNIPGQGDCGDPIALSDNCTDIDYSYRNGYGNVLRRDCGNGVEEWYAHLSGHKDNAYVNVGTTGGSTGCHLHYEIRIDGSFVDPVCVWSYSDPNQYLSSGEIAQDGNVTCPDLSGLGTSYGGTTGIPDLCNEQVRQALKDDAKAKLNGNASAGQAGEGKPPQTSNTTTPNLPPGTNVPSGYEGGTDGLYTPPVVEYVDPPSTPSEPAKPSEPAEASGIGTGITQEMIDTAKNEYVDNATDDPHLDYSKEPEGDCEPPAKTGLITNRFFSAGRIGAIGTYDDAFCTQQGCAYVNENFASTGGGEGECQL